MYSVHSNNSTLSRVRREVALHDSSNELPGNKPPEVTNVLIQGNGELANSSKANLSVEAQGNFSSKYAGKRRGGLKRVVVPELREGRVK